MKSPELVFTLCVQSLVTEDGANGQAILPVRTAVAVGFGHEHDVATTLHQPVADKGAQATVIKANNVLVLRVHAAVGTR